jgi:hypothetical protein
MHRFFPFCHCEKARLLGRRGNPASWIATLDFIGLARTENQEIFGEGAF